MKTFLLPFILVLIATPCAVYGQVTIEKIRNGKGHSFHHYLAVPPGNVQGILLLLPGLGEKPGAVLQKTNLPILAAEIGFLTIIPDLGKNIIADKEITTGLSGLINVYAIKYDLRELRLVVGGFSRGGSISIRYAEHLVASNSPIKLKGVFAIDPALDLKRLYLSSLRIIAYACSPLIKKEGQQNKRLLEEKLGGTPTQKEDNYIKYSGYYADVDSGGNAKYLRNLPVRLYSEPDLAYVRNTFCNKFEEIDINAFDLQRLNSLMLNLGNVQCEYITTSGKGFHSWKILDSEDCVQWILQISK